MPLWLLQKQTHGQDVANILHELIVFCLILSENIPCWTLEQINDQIYLDNDLNQDDSLDATERLALVTKWGINGNENSHNLQHVSDA